MNVKKIGAILAGAVMIGSAVAAAWNPAEHKDFFVDPETGEPNAVVVVGTNAAAADVTAAGWIAAQIGNMAYYEEEIPQFFADTWSSGQLDPGEYVDVSLVGEVTGSFSADELLETLWWNDANENDKLDSNEEHEEIVLDLDENATEGSIGTFSYIAKVYKNRGGYIHFLGHDYTTLRWWPDKVLCADSYKEDGAKFYLNETLVNGWTINMDIDEAFWDPFNKLDVLVTDPKGGTHEALLGPLFGPSSGPTVMRVWYDPDTGRYTDNHVGGSVCVFRFKYEGCFLGTKNKFVLANVFAANNFKTIQNAYCLRPSGLGGPEYNLIVDSANKEIRLDFTNMPGYMGTPYYIPYMTIPLAAFDPTQVETFWVNENPPTDPYITVNLKFDYSIPSNPSDSWYIKEVTVHQEFELEPKIITHPVDIDPTEIVMEDSYIIVNPVIKSSKNLILVGGPGLVTQGVGPDGETFAICNQLTKDLVDLGLSKVDWFTSPGEYEYIADAFADGKDVIIVAGADRIGTKQAVQKLLEDLTA